MLEISVKKQFVQYEAPKLINIPGLQDSSGDLRFWDDKNLFPQGIQRCFWITQVSQGVFRGQHAHWQESQLIVSLAGNLELSVEGLDGKRLTFQLLKPDLGIFIPPLNWVSVSFSSDAVLLGLSDRAFQESDYIRDLDTFRQLQFSYHEQV